MKRVRMSRSPVGVVISFERAARSIDERVERCRVDLEPIISSADMPRIAFGFPAPTS